MKKILDIRNRLLTAAMMIVLVVMANSCSKSKDMNPSPGTKGSGGNGGPATNAVTIQGMAFSPSTITVAVNTTVTWTNKDAITHTVTSDSNVFDSGNVPAGSSFSHTFTATGTFPYHCKIHPSMVATVVVSSSAPTTMPSTPTTPSTPSTPGY
jgi:plastocyanin